MYLPILTYHRILLEEPTRERDPQRIAVSLEQFRRQMTWLKRLRYHVFPLEKYPDHLRLNKTLPSRSVAITFDDGYEEVFRFGLPVLKEFGFPATVFAVAEELGGQNAWDGGGVPLMSIDHYKEWAREGMNIGAHSCRHKHLTRENGETQRHEIIDAKHLLEDSLGQRMTTFAYPYGESDARVETLIKEAGYAAAFATDRALRNHVDNIYRIRRAVVFPKNAAPDILHKIQPWYPAYQDWKRRGEKKEERRGTPP